MNKGKNFYLFLGCSVLEYKFPKKTVWCSIQHQACSGSSIIFNQLALNAWHYTNRFRAVGLIKGS